MFYKRALPAVVLLACMPFLSALAMGDGAVNFKNTLVALSELYRQGEYEQALDYIQLSRQRPLGTSELGTLSLYEGIVLYSLDRHVESGDAFQMALLLQREVRLPEQVSPKIESFFETIRLRLQQERDSADAARPAPDPRGANLAPPPECASALVAATGRTLKAQQLWRLAMMERMLCARRIRGGELTETLAALKAQVTGAGTSSEWMRVSQGIDRLAHQYALYPSNEDWRRVKAAVPEEKWELGDEDQGVPLPEGPIAVIVDAPSEQEPANLFGCRAAVAPECEELMRRLLLLQNQTLGMNATLRRSARQELFRLGQRVREARSSEELEEASEDIDAWPEIPR